MKPKPPAKRKRLHFDVFGGSPEAALESVQNVMVPEADDRAVFGPGIAQ
jgi:hypothetical protein